MGIKLFSGSLKLDVSTMNQCFDLRPRECRDEIETFFRQFLLLSNSIKTTTSFSSDDWDGLSRRDMMLVEITLSQNSPCPVGTKC